MPGPVAGLCRLELGNLAFDACLLSKLPKPQNEIDAKKRHGEFMRPQGLFTIDPLLP